MKDGGAAGTSRVNDGNHIRIQGIRTLPQGESYKTKGVLTHTRIYEGCYYVTPRI